MPTQTCIATFPTVDDFFAALLGPRQHDAHVERYRAVRWMDEQLAGCARGAAAVEAIVAEEREREAQRVAADYGFNTATIRQALHRWEAGCFSGAEHGSLRTARIRQLTRALDIACEHHAMAGAAE